MKTIDLGGGQVAVVDDSDYALVSQYKWHAKKARTFAGGPVTCVYAEARKYLGKIDGRYVAMTIKMHRLILGLPAGRIDHIDNDGLNNQRNNLRHATHAQNMHNRRKHSEATCPWKGVYWYPNRQLWHSSISAGKRRFHLGYFRDACDAATAYNFAAYEYHKEFARYNV